MTYAEKIFIENKIAKTDRDMLERLRKSFKDSLKNKVIDNQKLEILLEKQSPLALGFIYRMVDSITISANMIFEEKYGKKGSTKDDYINELGLLVDSFYFLFNKNGFHLFDKAVKIYRNGLDSDKKEFFRGEELAKNEMEKLSKVVLDVR